MMDTPTPSIFKARTSICRISVGVSVIAICVILTSAFVTSNVAAQIPQLITRAVFAGGAEQSPAISDTSAQHTDNPDAVVSLHPDKKQKQAARGDYKLSIPSEGWDADITTLSDEEHVDKPTATTTNKIELPSPATNPTALVITPLAPVMEPVVTATRPVAPVVTPAVKKQVEPYNFSDLVEHPASLDIDGRRLAGLGCDMTLCSDEANHRVGGVEAQPMPHFYIIIPFRNRFANLARLTSSLNNATTLEQKRCTCVVLADYESSLSALPAWQNPHCIATYNEKYQMYMQENDYDMYARHVTAQDVLALLAVNTSQDRLPCPTEAYGSSRDGSSRNNSIGMKTTSQRANQSDLMEPLPLHVNLAGLSDVDALRHILGFYHGSSVLVESMKRLNTRASNFSKAGGILAGLLEAANSSANNRDRAIAMVLDADMIVQPGALEKIFDAAIRNHSFALPTVWQMCHGISLGAFKGGDTGFASKFSPGMIAGYVDDFLSVSWQLRQLISQTRWGGEDVQLLQAVIYAGFNPVYFPVDELVHVFHMHVKAWDASSDGISLMEGSVLDSLNRFVCESKASCYCPNRDSAASIVKLIESSLSVASNPRQTNFTISAPRASKTRSPSPSYHISQAAPVPIDRILEPVEDNPNAGKPTTIATQKPGNPPVVGVEFNRGRRLAGLGCDMTLCSDAPIHRVGGVDAQPMPHFYIIIPFRNRFVNLARLTSSLNSATTLEQKRCTCIVLADYESSLSALPAWQNPHCIATYNDKYKMYMQENDYDVYARHATTQDVQAILAVNTSQDRLPCPTEAYGSSRVGSSHNSSRGTKTTPVHANLTELSGLPLHVNLADLSDLHALRHILGFYHGSSVLIESMKRLNTRVSNFSKAGGILAGLLEAANSSANNRDRAIAMVLDADMIVRPGALEKIFDEAIRNHSFALPSVWQMCHGISLNAPKDGKSGFASKASPGMIAGYVDDFLVVSWKLKQLIGQKRWGGEDVHLLNAVISKGYRPAYFPGPEFVHVNHMHAKAWDFSSDGISLLGGILDSLSRFVCESKSSCYCPNRDSADSIVKLIKSVLPVASKV